jgi:hypothetical protein
MRLQQDRAAGRFIDAARLHADEAILDKVEPANAIVAAKIVERRKQGGAGEFLAVERDSVTRQPVACPRGSDTGYAGTPRDPNPALQ